MISLTPEEIITLVRARDLLKGKLAHADPTNSLELKHGYDGVMGVLKHAAVDVS
jgi:hypothetical protein